MRETVMVGENTIIYLDYTPGPQEPPDYRVIVTFNAENIVAPEGEIINYNWSFGDGNQVTGIIVSHEYPIIARIYIANLTIIDNHNNEYYYLSMIEIAHIS